MILTLSILCIIALAILAGGLARAAAVGDRQILAHYPSTHLDDPPAEDWLLIDGMWMWP